MDKHKLRLLLKRYQNGTANETERALVEAWYESYHHENNSPVVDNIKNDILLSVNAAIRPQINLPRRSWISYLTVAACILVVPTVILFTFLHAVRKDQLTYTTIETKAGEIKSFTLPDSSVVWVNASSRIKFPDHFDVHRRDLYVENGEAFFDIRHKPNHPFIVHVQKLLVQVLGTSFNINAYHNLNVVKVMVANGKVGISAESKQTVFLTRGQELSYNNITGTYSQYAIDINKANSWKSGFTYLQQATFNELAGVMHNQLGVMLQPGSPAVSRYHFTLRIQQNLPLSQTLQMINQMHSTHYRKEGNRIIIY